MNEENNLLEIVEEFRPVVGYEGHYEVSNFGKIISLKDNKRLERKPSLVGKGYLSLTVSKDGISKQFRVHRLVAIAFIPNPNNLPEVNHKNRIKTDNHINNLEWCTSKENTLHWVRSGANFSKGSEHHKTNLTDEIVLNIRHDFDNLNFNYTQLSKKYHVGLFAIRLIISNKSWKHLPYTKTYEEKRNKRLNKIENLKLLGAEIRLRILNGEKSKDLRKYYNLPTTTFSDLVLNRLHK